jgi:serine/threonine-protein kinase
MALVAGSSLGHYQILAMIGKGGMGEVYRARDARLDRDVAIKILPPAFAADADRMARFEREAKVLASLNHPNIAAIYAVEERALVMELVEGETLAGPLPIDTALDYARQIAEALEAAHDKGITHRDLKPANVRVTPQGVAKVLDFGLAAVAHGSASAEEIPANSPTLTMSATQAGLIMGTAAYMSPEQAAGKPVDRRADVWSFRRGAVGVAHRQTVIRRRDRVIHLGRRTARRDRFQQAASRDTGSGPRVIAAVSGPGREESAA